MAKTKAEPTYEVGYGRPPKHTQFKPGQSGNPKGRPKGIRNLSSDVKHALRMPVVVTQNGKKKRISTQLGGLLTLREKALKGDARALDLMIQLAAHYNDDAPPALSAEALAAEDQAILTGFEARRRAAAKTQRRSPKSKPSKDRATKSRRRSSSNSPRRDSSQGTGVKADE